MVRLSLGLVFVWFGALKAAGDSPVLALVSATLPWADPQLLMPVLGVVEVLLGVGLLLGRAQRLLLLMLAAHPPDAPSCPVLRPGSHRSGTNPAASDSRHRRPSLRSGPATQILAA